MESLGTPGHTVHFWRTERGAATGVAEYIREGLAQSEDVLAIVTPERGTAVLQLLRHSYPALTEALTSGQLTIVDARTTLDAVVTNGVFEPPKIRDLLLPFAQQSTRPKRLYGEVVMLLVASGQLDAALALEQSGHALGRELGIRILCGYEADRVEGASLEAVAQIARHHDSTRFEGADDVTVLLADDYQDARDLYHEYLSFRGYRVVLASDGFEALEKARAARPDVLLLDVRMPGMTGTEVMKALKADPTFSSVPVVALTAHALDYERAALLDAGFDAVITKPCLPDDLARMVARLAGNRASE